MTANYKILRDLILKTEGKTLEDEMQEDGFKVLVSNNAWYIKDRALEEVYVHHPYTEVHFIKEGEQYGLEEGYYFIEHEQYTEYGEPSKYENKVIEILGKDIELARVLRALGKKEIAYGFKAGQIIEWRLLDIEKFICMWNLEKPLHLQSEETITKLNEILK